MSTITLRRLVPTLRSVGLSSDAIAAGDCAQALVYLLDRAGAALGYRYKWDVFGPVSPELAEDLNELDIETIDVLVGEPSVAAVSALERIEALRQAPAGVSEDRWLRLLACVDFLEQRAGVSVANGDTPPFLSANYEREVIDAARNRVAEVLT